MNEWEIINPSDHYTIQAARFEVAVVATLILGNGQYALRSTIEGGDDMPLMLFGPESSWFQERFGQDFEGVVDTVTRDELSICLDSVLIGNRGLYEMARREMAAESRREFRIQWHDAQRSSLNDIGRRAWELAARLAEKED